MNERVFSTPKNKKNGMETVFKTPYSLRTPKYPENTPKRETSNSDESVSSSNGIDPSDLSIVAEFDDFMRLIKQYRNDKVDCAFLNFIRQSKEIVSQYHIAVRECRRLQELVDGKTRAFSDLENKLSVARKLLDQEKRLTRRAEEDKYNLEVQIAKVKELLLKDNRTRLPEETRQKLAFLNQDGFGNNGNIVQLSAIQEVNTTGSLLSDFSYSRSEDDLDSSVVHGKTWKKHRPSGGIIDEPVAKKPRSSGNHIVELGNTEKVRATTTVTVPREGPITAVSTIESIPIDKIEKFNLNLKRLQVPLNEDFSDNTEVNVRQHTFQNKTIVRSDTCDVCEKRIRFGKLSLKCKLCKSVCHPDCKDKLPLPCVPCANTPKRGNILGKIGDYTPTTPPMIPAIIVHCLKEIESRGLNELGLYRISGSERDVKCLKEKFLRGRGVPRLNQIDIHVICSTVKDFLRWLQEPLVTYSLWKDFVAAVEAKDIQDITPALYQVVSELPQPNRDTLAYMVLHLKRVGASPDCKMPIENLSKVFGPTIIGYSCSDPDPQTLLSETRKQVMVMEYLLNLPNDYWASFLSVPQHQSNKLQQTPSTDSLLTPVVNQGLFTPTIIRSGTKRIQKFFPTPPTRY